jgi:hypothetical protein
MATSGVDPAFQGSRIVIGLLGKPLSAVAASGTVINIAEVSKDIEVFLMILSIIFFL